jgi:hypothetical protein
LTAVNYDPVKKALTLFRVIFDPAGMMRREAGLYMTLIKVLSTA